MSPFKSRFAAIAAALAVTGGAFAAHAYATNTEVVVVNDNNRAMVQLYVGARQVLGAPVAPGQSVRIDANEGGGCVATITAVFEGGAVKAGQINACQVGQYNATARGIPFCPGDPRCKRAE